MRVLTEACGSVLKTTVDVESMFIEIRRPCFIPERTLSLPGTSPQWLP